MSSNAVDEIERAIGTLSAGELAELYSWLERNHPQPIDARIPTDLAAGNLDKAMQRALDEEKAGDTRHLG